MAPLIAGGVAMVALCLAMPRLLMKYRTSMIARLLLGPMPSAVVVGSDRKEIPLQIRCVGCGAAIPRQVPD
jgi:hypothetical protein